MERNRLSTRFGLRVSKVIAHAGTSDVNLHEVEVDVPPGERNEFRAKSNLSRTLKTMERYGLIHFEEGTGRQIAPRVTIPR